MENRIYLEKFSGNDDYKFFRELTSNNELMEMNYGRIFTDIEYSLLPQYWHKGYGTEIAQHLLNLVKDKTSINVVTATIDPNNIGSRKILLKLGFEHVKSYRIDDGSLAEDFVLNIR